MSDAWGDDKLPGISWKLAKKGQKLRVRVEGPAKEVNRKDFDTGEIARYDDGNPKKALVFPCTILEGSDMWPVDEGDEELAQEIGAERAYFLNKPSQPLAELGPIARRLRKERGWALDKGDILEVELVDLKRKEGAKKGSAPQKFFSFNLVHEASTQPTEDDAFDDDDE